VGIWRKPNHPCRMVFSSCTVSRGHAACICALGAQHAFAHSPNPTRESPEDGPPAPEGSAARTSYFWVKSAGLPVGRKAAARYMPLPHM
jgi:hypothetical protein